MSLKVEEWPIDRLVPYARNPRKNDAVVAKMVSAIREFGFRIPIVAKSDGSIVDGHLRYKAAQEMGLQTVPVALADELTETQVKAFRLLANRSANWAEWDDDLLKLELEELQAEDFPIEMIGFEPEEIAFSEELSQDNTDKNEDNIPELLPGIISQTGDVWVCREHRIMCGDSTNLDNITLLMKGHKANLCLTDPPYGVKRDKGFDGKRAFSGGKGKRIPCRRYEDDDWDSKTPDKKAFENILNNSAQAIIFGGNFLTDKLPCNGFWIVWDKHNSMPTFGDCELAWTNIKRNSVKKV